MYGDALTTKERIKERLGITVAGFDALIDRLIVAATGRIQSLTNRRFIQGTFNNELHDGSDIQGSKRQYLITKNAPLASVTRIEYNAGTEKLPVWTEFDRSEYQVDAHAGLIRFPYGLPYGFQNVRITYTGGFSGYSIGLNNFWLFNAIPTGLVNGTNRTFTLPEVAAQIIVYADGMRESASNITFTPGTSTFTLAPGRAPVTSIAVDYLRGTEAGESDYFLPADLVEICEQLVVRKFKKRESEGRSSESLQESSITWAASELSEEDHAIIRSYRRGYDL